MVHDIILGITMACFMVEINVHIINVMMIIIMIIISLLASSLKLDSFIIAVLQ